MRKGEILRRLHEDTRLSNLLEGLLVRFSVEDVHVKILAKVYTLGYAKRKAT